MKLSKKLNPKFFQFILKSSYLFLIGVFLLDFIRYQGFVQNNLLISPLVFLVMVFVLHLVIIWKKKQRLDQDFVVTNSMIFIPLVIGISVALYLLEEKGFLFPNYFYTNFKFHYVSLPWLVIPALIFSLLHATKSFMHKYLPYFGGLITVMIILLMVLYWDIKPLSYAAIIQEDNLVEYLTAFLFLISGAIVFSLLRFRQMFQPNRLRKLFVIAVMIIGVALTVIAAEEISWGQRILGIETPEFIAQQNTQDEITLHNSDFIWPYVYKGYALVGLYGMGAWVVRWLFQDFFHGNRQIELWQQLLIPSGYLFINFGLIVLYVWLRTLHGPWRFQPWEEFSEMVLVFGIFIHVTHTAILFASQKKVNVK